MGKAAVKVNAYGHQIAAQLLFSGLAIGACSAIDVRIYRHVIPDPHRGYATAGFHHHAGVFMA